MGYLNLHKQFSTNLKYHGNEEHSEELLKLVKTQKILTAGIKNHSKKCFEQNDQYNVTMVKHIRKKCPYCIIHRSILNV